MLAKLHPTFTVYLHSTKLCKKFSHLPTNIALTARVLLISHFLLALHTCLSLSSSTPVGFCCFCSSSIPEHLAVLRFCPLLSLTLHSSLTSAMSTTRSRSSRHKPSKKLGEHPTDEEWQATAVKAKQLDAMACVDREDSVSSLQDKVGQSCGDSGTLQVEAGFFHLSY